MSKITYRIDTRSFDDTIADNEAGWSQAEAFGSKRQPAYLRFTELEDAAMQQPDEPQYRLVAVLQPCSNAPIDAVCQFEVSYDTETGRRHGCERDAVVDAPAGNGRWGYWCMEHWVTQHNLALVNVITATPLELVLVES